MIAAQDWMHIGVLTLGCAAVGLLVGGLLLRVLRSRSVAAHLVVVSVAALATVAAAVLVTANQMLLSEHDSTVVLVVVLLSTPAAVGVAALLGLALRRDTRQLAESATAIGAPDYARPPRPATAELRALAAAIDETHTRLVRAQQREAVLEEGRRELVAWVSHDLRTPLAGMRAMVEALEDGMTVDDGTVRRYHRQLRAEVERMSEMVSDLFELSRIQGSLQLQLERVGAGELVEEALASAYPVARAKGVRLVSSGASGLPVSVDPTEFGRVLRNLLLNAIRHTPHDGTISVLAEPDGARHVSLSVSDSCGGIPDDDLPRVFETAFRGNSARTTATDERGGLGLAIARGIVEAHAGDISVANLDNGCRFRVRLPLATDA
jgi:signal transduction histidine kinase